VFGEGREDVAAMGNRLIGVTLLDELFDFAVVNSQRDFCHSGFLFFNHHVYTNIGV
jgi:hypothetical protein